MHASSVPPKVAVSATQLALIRAAEAFESQRGRWPSARQLAIAADLSFPETCEEVKSLERVGVVEWSRVVRVVRAPDGFFLSVGTEPTSPGAL